MRSRLFCAACVALASVPVLADEVVFKNGDHLTGKVELVEGGKLTLASAMAGKVTIDLANVRTFATDGPVALKLKDGTLIDQKLAAGPDGSVAIAPGGAVPPRDVPLGNIKTVNYKEQWTGSLAVGGMLARGNTNTDSLNANFDAVLRRERDRTTVDAGFIYGRERVPGSPGGGKHETANDWFVGGKYDYFFEPRLYGYANARVERDLIANISLRLTPGVGAGYQWVDKADFHFNTEAGVSYLYRKYRNDGSDESAAVRLAYHLDKKLNDKVSLFHNLEYFPGLNRLDNYYFTTDAGIRASITSKMFTEFKVREQYDAQPAPGKGYNDTRFMVNVGWNF